MERAEVARYRAMLQAQAVEPGRRGLFRARTELVVSSTLDAASHPLGGGTGGGPPPQRSGSLFGRRSQEPEATLVAVEPMVLDTPAPSEDRLRLRPPMGGQHLSETPYHVEDLADPPAQTGPAPGIIAGWSNVKPASAQVRLLRRLGAVIVAERHGLMARLAAVGIDPA